jgi:hypothetical protein
MCDNWTAADFVFVRQVWTLWLGEKSGVSTPLGLFLYNQSIVVVQLTILMWESLPIDFPLIRTYLRYGDRRHYCEGGGAYERDSDDAQYGRV